MKSIADIKAIRDKMQSEILLRDNSDTEKETRVVVGMATCGISAGAREVFNAFIDDVVLRGLKNVKVTRSGCLGTCELEPVVEVYVPGKKKVTYVHVTAEMAKQIVENHIVNGNICNDFVIND